MAVIYAGSGDTTGTTRNDEIYGDSSDNAIDGGAGHDWIQGNRGDDSLWGWTGNDTIWGGSGDDFILGEAGRDVLTGYGGYDAFVFTHKPAKSNIDTITDFSVKYDTFVLSTAIFKGVGAANRDMKASAFWTGTKAHDADDRIIYNKDKGALYYDPDGTGSKSAVQIATIDKNLKLTYKDFYIMNP
jgi:Ca2+-binding RTX toxin-like protein